MKKWSAIFLAVFILLMVRIGQGRCEGMITIKGKIKNTQDYNMQAAYFQLVAWDPENKDSEPSATGKYDIDNRLVSVELLSDLPKYEIMDNGNLTYKLKNLKAGRYVMVVQRLQPKNKPAGYLGPGPFLCRPLAKEKIRPIVIEILSENKPPFTIDLGDVFVPFKESDRFIILQFDNIYYAKP